MKDNKVAEIDLLKLLAALWKKKFLIAIIAVLFAVLAVFGAEKFIVPEYESDILVYVNNNSVSLGGASISFSSGEINAAKQLLDSYVVALNSRACMDAVIEKANLSYTREQLQNMVVAASVNDTEWFTVTVTSTIPEEATTIANAIAEVLPDILSGTIKGSSVEVVDYAIIPEKSTSPGRSTYAAYGFIIGFVLVCGIVVVKELLNNKIHDEETIGEITKAIPVLATISHKISNFGGSKKDKSSKEKEIKRKTPICDELDFAAEEAYKLLQTSVQYSFDKGGCKVIGVTSSLRNEGKSTIAVNLAYTLSRDNLRVLLIDGDMRLPTISNKLSLETTPGLSEYLTGKIKNNDGIQFSQKAPNVSVICAGVMPPNPFELLGSQTMGEVLKEVRALYDYVIVDLPPINIVSDALAVSKYLDGFVVAVRSEYTTKPGVIDVCEKLKMVNSHIIGFVINATGSASESKYGKYGKYGKHGYDNTEYAKSYEQASASKKSTRNITMNSDSAETNN